MATIKSRKITKIVREFVKQDASYDITGVDLGLAKYLWRVSQDTFQDLAAGDYRIDQSNGKQTLVILNAELLAQAEAFQVGYVLDFTASEYDTKWNVDINQLKEKYNTLVQNTQSLWEYVRLTGFIADDTTINLILPQLDDNQFWFYQDGKYKAYDVSDFRQLGESLIEAYAEYQKSVIELMVRNARENIQNNVDNGAASIQNLLNSLNLNVENFTGDKKLELQKIIDDFRKELEVVSVGNANTVQGYVPTNFERVENTIKDLVNAKKYKEGDVVEVLGYYTAGDGAGHKRKIEETDDGSGVQLANGLWANIVHDGEVNVSWFGAKGDGVFDNTNTIKKAFDFCKKCLFSNGEYYFSGSILLKNDCVLIGSSRDLTTLVYGGDSDFIISEDVSDCRNIKIENMTVMCSGKRLVGTGIRFLRTTKSGDTWHKISNVQVMYFEYGMKLLNNLNEMQLEFVNCRYNKTGCYLYRTYDMFFANCVFSVNKRHGLEISNSGEIRFASCKSWYNGNEDDSKYCNLFLTSAKGVTFSGLGLQESYGTNCRIEYSEGVVIQGFLSQPALTSETAKQVSLRATNNCNIDITTENKRREGEYKHSLLHIESLCRNNTINIKYFETDFPEDKKFIFTTQHSSSAFVGNTISITNPQRVHERKIKNYAKNGDLSNKTTLSFLYYPSSNIYFEDEKLILNASAETTNLNFNTAKIEYPNTTHTMYCVFKKISGAGRVTANYSGWVDVAESDDVGTMYQVAYWLTPTSQTPLTNVRVAFSSGLVVEVVEIGFVPSMYCHSGYPLVESAKIPVVSYSSLDTPYHTTKMQQEGVYEDFIEYMDSQHKYDKEQKALESAKQEAYQLALAENSELVYEEWLSSYPELMPAHQEPVPSEALQAFYNEYK